MWSRSADNIMEKFFYLISKEGIYNFAWIHTLISKSPIDKVHIERAVATVASGHPLLRSILRRDESNLYWEELPDAVVPVYEITDQNWIETMHLTLDEVFDFETTPLWCVYLIKDEKSDKPEDQEISHKCQVYFKYSHAILDSTTVKILFKEFLEALDNLISDEAIDKSSLDESLDLPATQLIPSLERKWHNDLLDKVLTLPLLSSIAKNVSMAMMGKNPWVKKHGTSFKETRPEKGTLQTRMIPKQLSRKETAQLIQSAKEQNVTVHNILETACGIALTALNNTGVFKKSEKIVYSYDVSLRRYMDETFPIETMMGPYVTSIRTSTKIYGDWKERFWEMVAERRKNIKKQLSDKSAFKAMSDVRMVNTIIENNWPVKEFDPNSRFNDLFNIGNMGNWNMLNDNLNYLRVMDAYNNVDESKFGQVFTFYFVTVADRLCISLTYHKNYANKELVENLWTSIYQILSKQVFVSDLSIVDINA